MTESTKEIYKMQAEGGKMEQMILFSWSNSMKDGKLFVLAWAHWKAKREAKA